MKAHVKFGLLGSLEKCEDLAALGQLAAWYQLSLRGLPLTICHHPYLFTSSHCPPCPQGLL